MKQRIQNQILGTFKTYIESNTTTNQEDINNLTIDSKETLRDLGMDSIDVAEFEMELEHSLNVRFDDLVSDKQTVAEMIESVTNFIIKEDEPVH
jgi:acyl carrier protein